MSESIKNHEATVMRMVGNLLSNCQSDWIPGGKGRAEVIRAAVQTARDTVAEVQRTAPDPPKETL